MTNDEKQKNFWELLVETYNRDIEKADELYTIEPEEDTKPINDIPDSIPIEWLKEHYGWLTMTGEIIKHWERENEID